MCDDETDYTIKFIPITHRISIPFSLVPSTHLPQHPQSHLSIVCYSIYYDLCKTSALLGMFSHFSSIFDYESNFGRWDECGSEEEIVVPKRKKVKKAKASSHASPSRKPPQSPPSSDADSEGDPPSYQDVRASIVRSLAQFPPAQHHRLAESISEESF